MRHKNKHKIQNNNYILALDESGTSSLKNVDKEFPMLALTGILATQPNYAKAEAYLTRLKLRYLGNEAAVLHRRDMKKHTNYFKVFSTNPKLKEKFYAELKDILRLLDFSVITTIIDKTKYINMAGKTTDDLYQLALTLIMERAIAFTDSPTGTAYIRIMLESRGRVEDSAIAAQYQHLQSSGSSNTSSERFNMHFCPYPEFRTKTDNEIGIEIADICAYSIARFVLDHTKDSIFEAIEDKIAANNIGNPLGYGIITLP